MSQLKKLEINNEDFTRARMSERIRRVGRNERRVRMLHSYQLAADPGPRGFSNIQESWRWEQTKELNGNTCTCSTTREPKHIMVTDNFDAISAHKDLEHKRSLEETNAATTRRSSADGAVTYLNTIPCRRYFKNGQQVGITNKLTTAFILGAIELQRLIVARCLNLHIRSCSHVPSSG